MYSVQKNLVYFIADRHSEKVIEMSKDELIVWIAHLLKNTRAGTSDPFRNINFSGNDKTLVTKTIQTWRCRPHFINGEIQYAKCWGLDTISSYELRSITVFDSDNKIVDIRDFIDEAKNIQIPSYKKEKRRTFKAGTLLLSYYWTGKKEKVFRFRQEAVPFIHKSSGNYTPKTHRFQNYKNKEKLRPKNRVSYDDMWDFPYRHTDRSWKSSFKCRHQWEKHLK